MRPRTIFLLSASAILLAGAAVAFYATRPNPSPVRTIKATRQDVVQDVSFTGRLQPKQTSHLSFATIGSIAAVYVSVGDQVSAGAPLAQLSPTAAQFSLAKTSADLAAAEEQNKIAWEKAEQAWRNTTATNSSTLAKFQQTVRDKKEELDQYRMIHEQVAREQGENDSTTHTAVANVKAAETAYHAAQQTLAEARPSTQSSADAARQAADLARAQYLATIQAAGSAAGLSSLAAANALAQHNLDQQTSYAPFDGTVTAIDKVVGETATTGETVVTVATIDQLELKANVTETDAAKLTINLPATVSFDALPPQEQWSAVLTHINPAAFFNEGVPNYTITLLLDQSDPRFRSGLTANITIHADIRHNVIAVPRRAVATRQGQQFVQLLDPTGQIITRQVSTGLTGSTGTIEVTSGLSENELVVIDASSNQ